MAHWLYQNLPNYPMLLLFTIIVGMLICLSKGADILVDEAVTMSVRWGVPKVVIGATIVSLGTTLPEASVSVAAAVGGNPDIALGNAIGSVICDSSLIIGIASLIRPLPVHRSTTGRQSWIQLGSGALLISAALPWSNLSRLFTTEGTIPQWAGFLFLSLLALYLYTTFNHSRSGIRHSAAAEDPAAGPDTAPIGIVAVKMIIGLSLIILASKILLPTVEVTAVRIGIPQSIIAATLIAFGTSLPELITAIQASRKGHGELAVGNIIGADILNILFVTGAAAAVTPAGLTVPRYFYYFHLPFMMVILIFFKTFLSTGRAEINRIEGSVMLLLYVLFTTGGYVLIQG
jgi:cation:H+ antiporter